MHSKRRVHDAKQHSRGRESTQKCTRGDTPGRPGRVHGNSTEALIKRERVRLANGSREFTRRTNNAQPYPRIRAFLTRPVAASIIAPTFLGEIPRSLVRYSGSPRSGAGATAVGRTRKRRVTSAFLPASAVTRFRSASTPEPTTVSRSVSFLSRCHKFRSVRVNPAGSPNLLFRHSFRRVDRPGSVPSPHPARLL
jgi:hypothetical protein